MPLCPLGLNDVLDAPCPFVVGELLNMLKNSMKLLTCSLRLNTNFQLKRVVISLNVYPPLNGVHFSLCSFLVCLFVCLFWSGGDLKSECDPRPTCT